ncbi:ABC transporter permease [Sporosarcina sp. FSL K6-1522]|uniref:ABC transporter permease n=1 Tax=Sporosarcina sp. FSL K6-1522 TaxID=2921554 RepID=UPI00315B20CB
MNVSINRIRAIFMKDYKEFSRNYAISTMVLLPLFLAFMYNRMGADTLDMYMMPINMTFAIVTTFIQCCLIAEEKENNTLRSLMMSPATIADILIGKSALVFAITAVIVALTMYMVGFSPSNLLLFTISLAISTIFYLALGIICGLFTKTVMEASVAVMPIMLIFSFGPMGLMLADTYPILGMLKGLPSAQLMLLEEHSRIGATADMWMPLLIISAWAIVALVIAIVLFNKRTKDD